MTTTVTEDSVHGSFTSPSCCTFHSSGKPGIASLPSNPAAIAATACSSAPFPGRYPATFPKLSWWPITENRFSSESSIAKCSASARRSSRAAVIATRCLETQLMRICQRVLGNRIVVGTTRVLTDQSHNNRAASPRLQHNQSIRTHSWNNHKQLLVLFTHPSPSQRTLRS